jgi:hypothetical protein
MPDDDFTLRSHNSRGMGPTSLPMQVQLSPSSTYVIMAISVEYYGAADCNGLIIISQQLLFKTLVVHGKTLDETLLTASVCSENTRNDWAHFYGLYWVFQDLVINEIQTSEKN